MAQPHFDVLLLLLLSAILTAESQTAPGDAAAMHALSKSIGADKALNWSPTSDPCSAWKKIGCTDGMVTRIQIGNIKDLSGTLPPEIGNLTSLTRLEVQYVGLTGPLPSLRGLSNLQVLYLHDNFFSFIPPDFFAGLSALTDVNLDNNPFEPWQIPESLKGCASLGNFSANNASVTGGVPDFFGTSFPVLFHLALSNNQLQGEIPPSFAHSGMSSLWLNNQKGETKLSGSIDVISNMTNLLELWLQSNSFSGPLPDFSQLKNLENMSFRDNLLTGIVPKSLTSLKSLKNVILTNNLLQGPVPVFSDGVNLDLDPQSESFCHNSTKDCDPRVNILLSVASSVGYPTKFAENWLGNDPCVGWLGISCDGSGNITVVNFQKMNLSGVISPDFQLLGSLQKLILSGNNLTGTIPPGLVNLKLLKEFDVSNNFLWGKVPSFNRNVIVNTDGNPNIGKDSGGPPGGTAPGSPNSGSDSEESSSGKKSSLGVIVGTVAAGVIVIGIITLLGFCYWKRKKQNFGPISSSTVIHPRHSGSDPEMVKITVGLNGGIGSGSETASHSGSGPGNLHVVEPVNMVISIQVLRNVTNNFSEENILGRGGFGTVYKGELHDGTMIAVKRMESGAMGSKGLNEFKSEISVLTKVRHRHLVSLLGYCLEGNERILVYEYMPQGTLSHHLFNWARAGLKPLEWKKRLSIGLDVARGVEYLHSLANQSFIHRDLKPSNILLGDDMKAKVADFGLVRLAPEGKHCSVETRLAGTFGYLAPEYAVTGRVTTKADVFSFGVILMELITGRKALDDSRPEESMHLVTWFRRMQLNKETFLQAIDPTLDLDDKETFASICTVSELAGHCCLRDPYQRPDMGYAVNTLSSLAEQWKPSEPNMDDGLGIDLDMTLPQALMRWQAFGDGSSEMYSGFSSSQISSRESTQTSIPTRPTGFAEPLNSADGR